MKLKTPTTFQNKDRMIGKIHALLLEVDEQELWDAYIRIRQQHAMRRRARLRFVPSPRSNQCKQESRV